ARGKQCPAGWLAERAPGARRLSRDEALAELTRRYFTSHGPATVRDFVWWSCLTVRDARAGLHLPGTALVAQATARLAFWFAPASIKARASGTAHLLPNYDEFLIAYKDREHVVGPS